MSASDVLSFWFGKPGSADYLQPRALWFTKSDATDPPDRRAVRVLATTVDLLAGRLPLRRF